MISLYQRAESFRKDARLLRLIRREEIPNERDFEISSREGMEIIDHLDDVVSRKKINVNNNTFTFHPAKRDFLFPALVNILVLVAVCSGIFLFAYFSKAREQSIISGSGVLISTEGKLLEKLKQESEEQLSKKDTEIAETRKKLEEINEERDNLQAEMEQKILSRENELREVLNLELAVERQKLQEKGLSSEAVEQQLRQLEIDNNRKYEQQLAVFIMEAEGDMQQQENILLEIRTEYENLLEDKQSEQLAMQNELKAREEELLEQLRIQNADSDAERSSISENLDQLRKQRQDEQLVFDQIQSFYEQINMDLKITDYNSALIKLEALKQYISEDAIASLPLMSGRRSVELFIIDSITKLIEKELSGDNADTALLIDNATRLAEVSKIVNEADSLYNKGDLDGAALLYLKAFDNIPVLRQSYDKLKIISDRPFLQEQQNLAGQIRAIEGELLTAHQQIKDFRTRLNLSAEELQLSALRRQTLIEQLTAAQKPLDDGFAVNITDSSQEFLALLQAKLLMKQILNSESIKNEYPDLYESVDKYFAAFGAEQRKEGEYQAMRDIIAFINILSSPETDPAAVLALRDVTSELKIDLYRELLEKLKRLIESSG